MSFIKDNHNNQFESLGYSDVENNETPNTNKESRLEIIDQLYFVNGAKLKALILLKINIIPPYFFG
jgi:hypothetical protein